MVKILHKAGNSTHSEVQETLEFQKTLPQKTSILSNLQTFLKKVIGTVKFTTLQYCLLYNKKSQKLAIYLAGNYDQKLVYWKNFKKQSAQNHFDLTLQKNVYFVKTYRNKKKIICQYRREE